MLAGGIRETSPVQFMTASLRRLCRCVTLGAMLATAAPPVLAQPIEAGSLDALQPPGSQDLAPDQARSARQGRRTFSPIGRETGAASTELPAAVSQQRGYGDAPPYGGYGGYGANGYGGGAGYGAVAQPGGGIGDGEIRDWTTAPFGGPGYQAPVLPGLGSPYGVPAFRGTAVGPQYSNQLPAYEGRFRR